MRKKPAIAFVKIMRLAVMLAFLLIIFTTATFAQAKAVKGTVTTSQGEPLSGVSVTVKGTTIGTTTDSGGKFEINVPNKGVLVFTFIGYLRQEMKVNNQAAIDLKLVQENAELAQVVVLGYGTQKKKDLTGTVASIRGKDLQVAPTPALFNNLAGKLTGVITTQASGQPGYDQPEFSIRGKSTFGNNAALVLVDGIERPYSSIDPNDIESVTVLKDAASAAVYGARAANGVVLITLKQGKSGKTQISYSGSIGTQMPTVRSKMMNSYEYAKYYNEARLNSGNTAAFTDAEVEKFRMGNDPAYPNTDWWAASVHESAPIQQHNLTIQGGADKIKFFISAGTLNQKGLYDLSSFQRNNLRTNINFQINENLSIMADVTGRTENRNQSAADFSAWRSVLNGKPTLPAYVPDSVEKDGIGDNGLSASPIGQFSRSGYDKNSSTYIMSTAEINYKLSWIQGLSAKGRFALDKSFYHSKTFTTPYTYYSYDNANKIYQSHTTGSFPTLQEDRAEGAQTTYQFSLSYDNKFGNHNVSGLLLYEQMDGSSSDISAYREGFLSPAIDQIFGGSNQNKNNGGSASENARQGYVGRVNYNYADKYLLQANFRYDGSYNFAPDKRWGFFPAVAAGWRVSEESFMKGISFLSNMKLRASYGQFGNDRISPFQYLTGYVLSTGYITGNNYNTGIVDAGLPNPNVTWETATNTDLGLDLGFFHGKLESELTYFHKRTKDILLPRNGSVPATFGATLPDENIGIVENTGYEIMLRHSDRKGNWEYSIEANLTHARSEVIFMDEPANVEDRIRKTGHPFDQFYGLVSKGFFQNQAEINSWADQDGQGNASLKPGDIKYQDINKDNVIDGFDVTRIGKSGTPEYVFGLNLGASYKGVGFITNFQGATAFNRYLVLDPFGIDQNALAVNSNAWRPDNPNAAYPRLTQGLTANNKQVSSQWLVDNTYLKLRNAEIYYTLPAKLIKKIGVQSLRVYVSGNNIITFSKRDFVDPELLSISGGDVLYYPHLKSYNAGINVNF
jgi:TonB-linked SusC/RagA family outer membrane protein